MSQFGAWLQNLKSQRFYKLWSSVTLRLTKTCNDSNKMIKRINNKHDIAKLIHVAVCAFVVDFHEIGYRGIPTPQETFPFVQDTQRIINYKICDSFVMNHKQFCLLPSWLINGNDKDLQRLGKYIQKQGDAKLDHVWKLYAAGNDNHGLVDDQQLCTMMDRFVINYLFFYFNISLFID